MRILSRAICTVIALLSLLVGLKVAVSAVAEHQIADIAPKLLRGEVVQDGLLRNALSSYASQPALTDRMTPSLSSVIARLSLLENVSARLQVQQSNQELASLSSNVRELLTLEPTQSFVWLIHFWLDTVLGDEALNWQRLELSYNTGYKRGMDRCTSKPNCDGKF